MTRVAICADIGSTYTKVAAIDLDNAVVFGTASHSTTVDSDVLIGLDAAISVAAGDATVDSVDACSSAGGGLRLAVVGYESLVTAAAGYRVGLSAGARVVHVAAGRLDQASLQALRKARPDVILLVGGTDGGDIDVLRHNANRLAGARTRVPVVLAGNSDVRNEAAAVLSAGGTPVIGTDNVLPRIGVLHPGRAREAIRKVFLSHVIGGKGLSRGPRFASLVRGATPDIVLTAVELVGQVLGGDLAVVDIGGATTDVYSVLSPDPDDPPAADVAGTLWHSRTVEGDLGVRWNAPGIVAAAVVERLLPADEAGTLAEAAGVLAANPSFLPDDAAGRAVDARLAALAAIVAVRRHARGESVAGRRTGAKDLSRLRVLVGSGGVLRHACASDSAWILDGVRQDHAGGWVVPRASESIVDTSYLLAPIGLMATRHDSIAVELARALLARTAHGQ